MKILLVNDDGIDAPGIRALVREFSRDHEVSVVAPVRQYSAAGHGASFFHDIEAQPREVAGAEEAWAVWGTPADCAFLGIRTILEETPDLLISGINEGGNLSLDNIYSGTLAAATEGLILGVPSMAVSLDVNFASGRPVDYRTSARIARELMPKFLADPDCRRYVLSINVPDLPASKLKGYRMTGFDERRIYSRTMARLPLADGRVAFHATDLRVGVRPQKAPLDGDIAAVEQGYVALTPIMIDWVDHSRQKQMKDWEKCPLPKD